MSLIRFTERRLLNAITATSSSPIISGDGCEHTEKVGSFQKKAVFTAPSTYPSGLNLGENALMPGAKSRNGRN